MSVPSRRACRRCVGRPATKPVQLPAAAFASGAYQACRSSSAGRGLSQSSRVILRGPHTHSPLEPTTTPSVSAKSQRAGRIEGPTKTPPSVGVLGDYRARGDFLEREATPTVLAWRQHSETFGLGVLLATHAMSVECGDAPEVEPAAAADVHRVTPSRSRNASTSRKSKYKRLPIFFAGQPFLLSALASRSEQCRYAARPSIPTAQRCRSTS